MRIGINALYLIPGGVGGTEIYLRSLIDALAQIDGQNEYLVWTNRETETSLVPDRPQLPSFAHVGVRPESPSSHFLGTNGIAPSG